MQYDNILLFVFAEHNIPKHWIRLEATRFQSDSDIPLKMIYIIYLINLIDSLVAYNISGYPLVDVIPPINKTMTSLQLGNITVLPSGGPSSDYSRDITNCTESNSWVFYSVFLK